jgi:hypothetical protein
MVDSVPVRKYSRSGRIGRWRATVDRPFPTLGWLVLEFTYAHLPSPANEKDRLVYTDEQARRKLEWFRLDPETGAFVHNRRLHMQEAKGWGKSPDAASLDIVDFSGPVCFDGWDADGQPVGVPWGTGDRPAPWIQIAAVSEGQTQNTWKALYAMLAANGGRAARDLRIDAGLTRCHRLDEPQALLEYVTASAGSREGQRITKATLDEPQLWTPQNGGHVLADTILGNLTKMGGRAVFTGNAYVKGSNSVAERFDVAESGVLRYARQPTGELADPRQDWPREKLLASLAQVYEGAPWAPLERIVDDAISATANWPRMKRLFWNIPSSGAANRWMPETVWEACAGDVVMRPELPVYANVAVDHDHRAAAVAIAQRQGDAVVLRVRHFLDDALPEGDYVDLASVERYVLKLQQRYPARVLGIPRVGHKPGLLPGPEVSYAGPFFERSAQGLRARGLVTPIVHHSQQRVAPAAEQLRELATAGRLTHDGDPELEEQMGRVEAAETARGWTLQRPESGGRIIAAKAAMIAVRRVMEMTETKPKLSVRLPRARR